MHKFFKVLSISALVLAANMAGHAAQVAELTVVSDKDPKAQWPLPLPPKACTLYHGFGAACRPKKPSAYDAPPACHYHGGHSHPTPQQILGKPAAPPLPSQEAVSVKVQVLRAEAAAPGLPPEVQLRFEPTSVLAALGRHHGLTTDEVRVQAIHLNALQAPARLSMQYVAEQTASVLPGTLLAGERFTMSGSLPPSTPATKIVVVFRGSGVDTAGGGALVPQSKHDWQAPQLRCVFQEAVPSVKVR